jgi:hypothetical protein
MTMPKKSAVFRETDRRRRVELIGRAAEDLLAGRPPDPEARLLLAAALQEWLQEGRTPPCPENLLLP